MESPDPRMTAPSSPRPHEHHHLEHLTQVLSEGWAQAPQGGLQVLKQDRVWSLVLADGRAAVLKDWGAKDAGLESRVAFYQDVIDHVVRLGVPAEIKLRTRAGGYIQRQQGHAFSLGLVLPESGDELDQAGAERLQRSYGEAIGQLHAALASYPIADAQARTWRKDVPAETEAALVQLAAEQPEWRRQLLAMIGDAEASLLAPLRRLPEQLILFDCHHGNLLRVGDRVSGFIDYDHLSIGRRVWDLGNFLGQDLSRRLDGAQMTRRWCDETRLLLAGYVSAHPLPPEERRAIWCSMVAARILDMAGSQAQPARATALLRQIDSLVGVSSVFG